MHNRKKLGLRIAFTILGVFAVAFIGLFCFYMLWEKAPDIEPVAPTTRPASSGEDQSRQDNSMAFDTDRQDGVYTILLVGNDDGNGNTDTIMVGKIDTVNHKMDFVSIPRDTLINADWEVRKINAVYWGAKNSGGNGIDALRYRIKGLTGFDVDCYAVIDLGVFKETVDALGGVYFDVPQAMDYEDVSQNLYIHIAPGYQLLNGEQAMGVCRYRSGYANGDLGRIEMQHQFLKACADQFVSLGNIPNISKVVDILSDGLDTNLTAANIAFFLRQALLCKSEDINFYTAPNTPDMVGGYSYAILNIWEWLPMVNECINPYSTPVEYGNVDIVYRGDGGFTATTVLQGEWYYNREPVVNSTTESDQEEEEPGSTTEPEGPTIIVIPSETEQPAAPEQTDQPAEPTAPGQPDEAVVLPEE